MVDTKQFYDALASYYHLIFENWDASMARQGDALVGLIGAELAQPQPLGARILDAACGIGTQTLPLAVRGFRLVARDFSPAAVVRLQRRQTLGDSLLMLQWLTCAKWDRVFLDRLMWYWHSTIRCRICSPTMTSGVPSASFSECSAQAGCSCARSATTTKFNVASLRPTPMVHVSMMGRDFS